MESLFLTSAPGKEKTAAPSVTLSDDPAMWPKELISALLERAPYLGQYAIDQQTLGQDDRRGYAYGFFNVTAKGAPDLRPSDGAPNVPAAAPKGVTLRVPFIVQRRRMKPLRIHRPCVWEDVPPGTAPSGSSAVLSLYVCSSKFGGWCRFLYAIW